MQAMKIYEMTVPGAKEKFTAWIAGRGGVAVWPCVNLSNLTGPTFTPALTDGKPTTKPGWQYGPCCETITDLSRFRFAREVKEVKRFRVAVRPKSSGMAFKLTKGSAERLKRAIEKAGGDSVYRFDYEHQEAVIEVPVWE